MSNHFILNGPYSLTEQGIYNVTKTSPGVYVLGEYRDSVFYISYVGRSDVDVANRLHQHIGKFKQFKFSYCNSAKEAFENECTLYHKFASTDRQIHPDRPNGASWKCPICSTFS